MGKIVNYISGISALFLATSFVYNLGFFSVVGSDWVADLVPLDLFSNFWTIFVTGFVLFSWIGAISFLTLQGSAIEVYYKNETFFHVKHGRSFRTFQIVSSLLITVIIFVIGLSSIIEKLFDIEIYTMPLAAGTMVLVLPVMLFLWPERKDFFPRNVLVGVFASISLFSLGHDNAWTQIKYGNISRIFTDGGHSICGRVIIRGERGFIISSHGVNGRLFLPRASIRSSESFTKLRCDVPSAARTN